MDKFEYWRKSMCYKTGLGLTDEEKSEFLKERISKNLKKQCDSCLKYRDWVFQHSPIVIFMLKQLAAVGGNIGPKNVACLYCDQTQAGGFNPDLGIAICQNYLRDKFHAEDIIAHELVHAYDHCKFNVNWLDLRHQACSEIRASSLSGECRLLKGFWKYQTGFTKGHQTCVRARAALSVMGNPNCKSKEDAYNAVDQVFDSCFNDTRPFNEIYK